VRYFLIILLTATIFAQAPPVPIENEWVKVIVAQNTPGQKSRLHKHDVNRVMVHLSAGTMRLAYEGKPVNDVKFNAGTVRWDPSGGMHTSENVGGTTYKIVEVELRKAGSPVAWPPKDPLAVAPKIYRLEFDNDQVRVVRVRIPAKGAIPQHEHATNRVTVALTDAKIQLTKADGSKVEATFAAGEPRWGMPDVHAEQSLVDHPIELIMIDIKSK
jgi:quercetin dioxygenase-like cupin family protein